MRDACYDYNLLVLAIPDIASMLGLLASLVRWLIFFIAAAQLVVTLMVARDRMDRGLPRRHLRRTPSVTWLVVAVGSAFAQWLTIFLRDIPPGMELERITT